MRVVVVGGGLAGLFAASELMANGVDDLLVVDKADEPGGVTRSLYRDGFLLEPAAGSFTLPHPHLSRILGRASGEVEPAEGASIRHVYIGGGLVTLRPSPMALVTPMLSISAKLRALSEPLVPSGAARDEESLAAFCRRRFGHRAGSLLSSLMAGGVFAGDPERLSVDAAFPVLAEMEREHGSVIKGALRRRRQRPDDVVRPRMHIPVGGMTELSRALASSLEGRLRGEFTVEALHREGDDWVLEGTERLTARTVVLAVRPEVAAELLGGDMADTLSRAVSAGVVVAGLGGKGPSPLPAGFGALVGPDEGMMTVGALFESSYAPHRAPDGSWLAKVIVGGARNPEVDLWSDEDLVARATEELGAIIGSDLSPGFVELTRHDPGIPQYVTGHAAWLADLDGMLENRPGLHLTGWGYRGVGVGGLATDAANLADYIVRQQGG